MNPGKLEEHPMPLIVTTLWFAICSSTSAFSTAASTPKSPHPGHQSGSTLPLRSDRVTCLGVSSAVAICSSPQPTISPNHFSNQDFMRRNRKLGLAGQLLLYCFDDVMRHERLPIVFSNVSLGYETGLTAKVARKLPAVVVLDNDGMSRIFKQVQDRVAVQRHQPPDLKLICGNSLFGKNLGSLFDHALG